VATGNLIGAIRRDDVTSFCAGTSAEEAAGKIIPCSSASPNLCAPDVDAAVD
jgi:hypothetical protein